MSRSLLCFALLACIAAASPTLAKQSHVPPKQHPFGLSDVQIQQLEAMKLTLVAPGWVPSGFVQRSIEVDTTNKKYTITYEASGHSKLVFVGDASPQNKPARRTDAPRGFLHQMTSTIGNLFNHKQKQNTTSTNLSGEEEADPSQMDVSADSHLIGPAHFQPVEKNCAAGQSRDGIAPAKYTLTGCNVKAYNLTKVYRLVHKVSLH